MKYGAPLLTDTLSGKIGGVVFTQARSGPTVRVRVRPSNPNSTAQANRRADLTSASRAYKALSTSNAAEWRSYGLTLSLPNGVGGQFNPSGISAFTQLATVFLAVTPGGSIPTTPPASPYTGDTITITGSGGSGEVVFTPSAANTSGSTTELLIAALKSRNRLPRPGDFRVFEYHVFTGSSDTETSVVPPGYYALAYRFVKIATGERGPIVQIGTFQST